MTENEAKIFIHNAMEQSRNVLAEMMLIMPKVFLARKQSLGAYYSNLENCKKEIQSCEVAVKALEEVQRYRELGTPEELQTMKDNGCFTGFELAQIAAGQMLLKEYQAIGTLEECKEARDKQMPKKLVEDIKQPRNDEWHNLKDQKPEDRQEVLTWDGLGVHEDRWSDDADYFESTDAKEIWWREMPEPPEV